MPLGRGSFPFEANNRKPQPAKSVVPDKHSMDFLLAFLATFNVLILGYDAVKIAGIIVHLAING